MWFTVFVDVTGRYTVLYLATVVLTVTTQLGWVPPAARALSSSTSSPRGDSPFPPVRENARPTGRQERSQGDGYEDLLEHRLDGGVVRGHRDGLGLGARHGLGEHVGLGSVVVVVVVVSFLADLVSVLRVMVVVVSGSVVVVADDTVVVVTAVGEDGRAWSS